MKIQFSKIIVSISFAILISIPAFAQSGGVLRAHIPFDFYVNKQKLAAGDYMVRRPSGSTRSILLIQQTKGKKGALTVGQVSYLIADRRNDMKGALVFQRFGPTYLLSEIRDPWRAETTGIPTAMDKVLSADRLTVPEATVIVALN